MNAWNRPEKEIQQLIYGDMHMLNREHQQDEGMGVGILRCKILRLSTHRKCFVADETQLTSSWLKMWWYQKTWQTYILLNVYHHNFSHTEIPQLNSPSSWILKTDFKTHLRLRFNDKKLRQLWPWYMHVTTRILKTW